MNVWMRGCAANCSASHARAMSPVVARLSPAIEQPRKQVAERAEPPQDGGHQTPHQGAVTVGQRLQPGMRASAVELVVQGAVLVQHAVKNIGRNPPRGEAGHLGGGCVSYLRHGKTSRQRSGNDAAGFSLRHGW